MKVFIQLSIIIHFVGLLCIEANQGMSSCIPYTKLNNTICALYVNYNFFLGNNTVTVDDLEEQFYSKLPEKYQYFPADCQNTLVANLCADTYRKCDDETSSNYGYSDGLPYERPCLQNCMNLQTKCPTLARLIGVDISCDMNMTEWDGFGTSPATLPYRYDHTNNLSQCNNMSSIPLYQYSTVNYNDYVSDTISRELEVEVDASVDICHGYVSEYSIPYTQIFNLISNNSSTAMGNTRNIGIANLTSVNIQTQLNKYVYNYLKSYLPRYSRSSCYEAGRSYACNTVFSSNFNVTNSYISEILLNSGITSTSPTSNPIMYPPSILDQYGYGISFLDGLTIEHSIPRRTDNSLYTNFLTECETLFSNEWYAGAVPDTSILTDFVGLSDENVEIIYEVNNTAYYVNQSIVSNMDLVTYNGEDTVWSSVTPFEPSCPRHFLPAPVDERHPSDSIEFVHGGGCVQVCKSPYWTKEEWALFLNVQRCAVYIPILPLSLIIYTWIKHKQKRKQYLVIAFMSISFVFNLVIGIVSFIPWNDHFCKDDITPISIEYDGLNSCTIQAIFTVYCWIALTMAWLLQIVEAMRKLLFKWKPMKDTFPTQNMVMVFGIPFLPVFYAIAKGKFGYTRGYILCTYHDPEDIEFTNTVTIGLPIFLMLTVGGVCMGLIILHMLQTVVNKKRMKILWQPVFFFVSFFGMWLGFLVFRITFQIAESKSEWRLWKSNLFFAFENNDGNSDIAYEIAGKHASHRPFNTVLLNIILTGTQGLVISGIYIVDVYHMWVPYVYKKLTGKLWIVNTAYEDSSVDTPSRSSLGNSGITTITAENALSSSIVRVSGMNSSLRIVPESLIQDIRNRENRSSTVSTNRTEIRHRNSASGVTSTTTVVPVNGDLEEERSGPMNMNLMNIAEVNSDAIESSTASGAKPSSDHHHLQVRAPSEMLLEKDVSEESERDGWEESETESRQGDPVVGQNLEGYNANQNEDSSRCNGTTQPQVSSKSNYSETGVLSGDVTAL